VRACTESGFVTVSALKRLGVTGESDSGNVDNLMRVVITALALSAVSFAVGVAGDLSIAAPPPPSAVVAIPAVSTEAVRARPLPPLHRAHALRTAERAKARSINHFQPIAEPEAAVLAPAAATVRMSPHLAQKVGDLICA
jgi:hypothetical protein